MCAFGGITQASKNILFFFNISSADWTLRRHFKFFLFARSHFIKNSNNFRNHIPCFFYHHGITNFDSQALYLIHIVQCRFRNDRPSDRSGVKYRKWCKNSRAPYIYFYIFNYRRCSFCRVFISNDSPWVFANHSKIFKYFCIIYIYYYSIDTKR